MISGRYPRHHGMTTNGRTIYAGLATLPGRLSQAGYSTHAVGSLHLRPIMADPPLRYPESVAFWKARLGSGWNGVLLRQRQRRFHDRRADARDRRRPLRTVASFASSGSCRALLARGGARTPTRGPRRGLDLGRSRRAALQHLGCGSGGGVTRAGRAALPALRLDPRSAPSLQPATSLGRSARRRRGAGAPRP